MSFFQSTTWLHVNFVKKRLIKPGDSSSGTGDGDVEGRCLKNAFTAPVTPSSNSIAFAISFAFSFTLMFLQGKETKSSSRDETFFLNYKNDKVILINQDEQYELKKKNISDKPLDPSCSLLL